MRRVKFLAGVCAWVAVLSVFLPFGSMVSYGADSSVIETVTVTFKTDFGYPEEIPDPVVTVSGKNCTLEKVEYKTEYDNWKPGKKVRAQVTVAADEGKVFPVSLNHTQCKVTGADFVSARSSEDSRLIVNVDYKPVMVLGNTEWAGWSSTNEKMAVWEPVRYATGYSVNLYGDNKSIKKLKVNTTGADFSQYIKDDGKTYFYEVKAIPTTSDEKKYLKEGEFVSSTEDDDFRGRPVSGTSSDGGYISGGQYIGPGGQKTTNSWKLVSDKWYYFDHSGNMAKGWQYINNRWYYMNQSGVMQTGWVNPAGDSWFYMTDSGDMCTGWIQPKPGHWYYLNSSGAMQRGWSLINGKWYYMDQSGLMRTGWVQVSGIWYYLYGDGSMAVNTSVDGWTIRGDGSAYQG